MTATSIFAVILATQAAPIADPPVPSIMSPLPAPPRPSPPPAVGIGAFPPQRARANLASYFSEDDYPAAALRGKEEGTAGFRLLIGVNGRVAGCTITQSSGFASLDTATCRILSSRARYAPARDFRSNPIPGADSGRVSWRLPEDPFDPLLEAEASTSGAPVATPKPPRPRPRAGPRSRSRAPPK